MKSNKLLGALVAAAGLSLGAVAQTADPISESAAVYATYQSGVTDAGQKRFSSAKDIDETLTTLGGHNAEQLSRGWVAYSALIASQDPEYRATVRDIEGYYGRDRLIAGLRNDVRYARSLKGGDAAISDALNASEADSRRIKTTAAYVKEQAYSLQGSGWAKARISNSKSKAVDLSGRQALGVPARADLLAALGSPEVGSVLARAGDQGASVWDGVSSAAAAIQVPDLVPAAFSRKRVRPGKEPVADQIATLAAYRVLEASATDPQLVKSAMTERETKGCMNMANLNLQQCVAAAAQQFEVPFCIGEHALAEVGQCIGKVYE